MKVWHAACAANEALRVRCTRPQSAVPVPMYTQSCRFLESYLLGLNLEPYNCLVPHRAPHMCRRRVVEHAAEVLAGGAHADKVAGVEARVQPHCALGAHACRVRPAADCAQARFCSEMLLAGAGQTATRTNSHLVPNC